LPADPTSTLSPYTTLFRSGYGFIAFSSLAIAIIGFSVWAHHMFVAGISIYGGMVFSLLSFLVAIPSGIKVFNWTATLYKGSIALDRKSTRLNSSHGRISYA